MGLPGSLPSAVRRVGKAIARGSNRRANTARRPVPQPVLSTSPFRQRVIVKTRVVNMAERASGKARAHMNYITRDGAGVDEQPAELFGAGSTDRKDFVHALEQEDHHFRLIISPENAPDDMQRFTRDVMEQMEKDLGTKLEWKAVVHVNTDHPHAHVVLRGVDEDGRSLFIPNTYLTRGLRAQAEHRLTRELGYRSQLDIENSLEDEVSRVRVTSLDRDIERLVRQDRTVDFMHVPTKELAAVHQRRLVRRAETLTALGVAEKVEFGRFRLPPDWSERLRRKANAIEMASRVERQFAGENRAVVDLGDGSGPRRSVIGEVRARGLADELHDRPYVVIDGADGRAYHKTFPTLAAAEDCDEGAIVRITPGRRDRGDGQRGRPFVEVLERGGLEKSIRQDGTNWLDDYGRNRTAGAQRTSLQRRLSEAAGRRTEFVRGVARSVTADARFAHWEPNWNRAVPGDIVRGLRDETASLVHSKSGRRFEGELRHIVESDRGRLGIVVNRTAGSFAAVPLGHKERVRLGQSIALEATPAQERTRNLVRMIARSRSL
ncbi:MAG: DUF3363 domain-containing protein [Parvibaculum sp.]